MESNKVLCLERHVMEERGHAPLVDISAQACKHGVKRVGATVCSECPYKLRLIEPKPAYTLDEILDALRNLRATTESNQLM
ncbi:MAG: hypothetical protein E3J86_03370 [Candidatus Thorarchaeota archaeon]|nr:MAG: hypothetical protein E3J86_03370 [Candidatus Thorarchaeota archaeon]